MNYDEVPNLEGIDLSENEQKVLATMLRLGKTGASHISKESRVTYGRIYEILGSLEEKGLVRVIPEQSKQFVPVPDELVRRIELKRDQLVELHKAAQKMEAWYADFPEAVTVVKGERNFKKVALGMKSSKKYDYSIKPAFRTDPEFLRDARARKKRGVKMKTLGVFNKQNKNAIAQWKRITPNIKQIECDGVAGSIVDDREVLLVLIESNTIMHIRDKGFAKFMRVLFESYYEYS